MSFPKPVPSKAALNALRGLIFTTSCSVVLLAEERRQRTKVARAAIENARKLHTIKARRSARPRVDARISDSDLDQVDAAAAAPWSNRRRIPKHSTERSQPAVCQEHVHRDENGRRNARHTRDAPISRPLDLGNTERIPRPEMWPLDARSIREALYRDGKEIKQSIEAQLGAWESNWQFVDTSSWRFVDDEYSSRKHLQHDVRVPNYFEYWHIPSGYTPESSTEYQREEHQRLALGSEITPFITPLLPAKKSQSFHGWSTPMWGSAKEMTEHYEDYYGGIVGGCNNMPLEAQDHEPLGVEVGWPWFLDLLTDMTWTTPQWGSQEEMTAYYDQEAAVLEASDIEWGLPHTPDTVQWCHPEPGKDPTAAPASHQELWSSQVTASEEGHGAQARLYKIFREIQSSSKQGVSPEHADLISQAKTYLLYSSIDGSSGADAGTGTKDQDLARSSARALIHDLCSASMQAELEPKLATNCLILGIAMLRKFPEPSQGAGQLLPGAVHPAGFNTVVKLIYAALARDYQAAEEIFDTVLPRCEDVPAFIAKLFQKFQERDDCLENIQWVLQHLTSQPWKRYGFFFDDAFLHQVLQRHGRILAQPKATSKIFAAVSEANSAGYLHIPRVAKFDIHMLLLDGALVHNIPEMCLHELKQLQNTDARRFAKDPVLQNADVLTTILSTTPQNFEASLGRLEELSRVDSDVFGVALAHVANACQQRLQPGQFMDVIWTMTKKYHLAIEDQWAQVGIDYYLKAKEPDFETLLSWLEYCQQSGWWPDENSTAYANWRLSLHGNVDHERSVLENAMRVAEQSASKQKRLGEYEEQRRNSTTLSPGEEHSMLAEVQQLITWPEVREPNNRIRSDTSSFWEEIRHIDLFSPWAKRWLMATVSLRSNSDFEEKETYAFDRMWQSLMKLKEKTAWAIFASNYARRQPSLPILRLAVMIRLRIDGDDLTVTEELIQNREISVPGEDVGDLMQPLLIAQIDRNWDARANPTPRRVLQDAMRRGHKIHDMIFNHAALTAYRRGAYKTGISICKLAAEHNGDGNIAYSAENCSNLMRAYASILAFDGLSSLLSMLVQQNPKYIKSRVFRDAFKSAMRLMAHRALQKTLGHSPTIAQKCRQCLLLLSHVRKSLRYDQAGIPQQQDGFSVMEEAAESAQISLPPMSDKEIGDLSYDSPRQTWLQPSNEPTPQNLPVDEVEIPSEAFEATEPDTALIDASPTTEKETLSQEQEALLQNVPEEAEEASSIDASPIKNGGRRSRSAAKKSTPSPEELEEQREAAALQMAEEDYDYDDCNEHYAAYSNSATRSKRPTPAAPAPAAPWRADAADPPAPARVSKSRSLEAESDAFSSTAGWPAPRGSIVSKRNWQRTWLREYMDPAPTNTPDEMARSRRAMEGRPSDQSGARAVSHVGAKPLKARRALGRKSSHQPVRYVDGRASNAQREHNGSSNARQASRRTNGSRNSPAQTAGKMSLNPSAYQNAWEENKQTPTSFDKMLAARRTNTSTHQAKSTF